MWQGSRGKNYQYTSRRSNVAGRKARAGIIWSATFDIRPATCVLVTLATGNWSHERPSKIAGRKSGASFWSAKTFDLRHSTDVLVTLATGNWSLGCPSSSVVERFLGKEEVTSSILVL